MKNLLLALLLLAGSLSLHAQNLITNSDFSQGAANWQGDGVTPQASTDPLAGKGLIVTLNPNDWTRIYQDFVAGPGRQYSIVVTFRLSSNFAPSQSAGDYQAINKRIKVTGFDAFGSMNGAIGQFYGTLGDPNGQTVACEVYSPNLKSTDVQTYTHTYPPIPVSTNKTFVFAFPPGTGTVDILSVTVTGK